MVAEDPVNESMAWRESRTYNAHMTPEREDAVRRALDLAPGSLRALAEEAGVSEALLRAVRDGQRRATQATVEALAGALERLAGRNAQAAATLRDTLTGESEEAP